VASSLRFEAGISQTFRIGGLDATQFLSKNGEAPLCGGSQQSLR